MSIGQAIAVTMIFFLACGGSSTSEGDHQVSSGIPYTIVDVLRAGEYCNVQVSLDVADLPSREDLEEIAISAGDETGGADVFRVSVWSPVMTPGEGAAYCIIEVSDGEITHFHETGLDWE